MIAVEGAAPHAMAESHQRVTVRGAGISLPPKQGNSNNGSFSEHPLNNGYTQKEVEGAAWHRSAIRFGINPATVFDANAWQKTQDVVRWARGAGATVVICMWGSNRNGAKLEGHGDGRVPNPGAARDAWRHVGEVFAGDEEVRSPTLPASAACDRWAAESALPNATQASCCRVQPSMRGAAHVACCRRCFSRRSMSRLAIRTPMSTSASCASSRRTCPPSASSWTAWVTRATCSASRCASVPRAACLAARLCFILLACKQTKACRPHLQDLWPGLLGYHIYPNWLPPSQRTASNFVALLRRSLRGVEHRTWVTEFGANTCLKNEDYHARGSSRSDIQFLHGLHTAFAILDLPATFVWHGWNNGDCYSLWAATPSARSKLGAIQAKAGGGESLALGSAPGMLTVCAPTPSHMLCDGLRVRAVAQACHPSAYGAWRSILRAACRHCWKS